jgi:hypothetical protein
MQATARTAFVAAIVAATACKTDGANGAGRGVAEAAADPVTTVTPTEPRSRAHQVKFPKSVSMIRLIANPEPHKGRVVGVTGFVSLEFEGTAVYMSEDDYRYHNSANALALRFLDSFAKNDMQNGQWCFVVGTFHGDEHGHLGAWGGTIHVLDIRACQDPRPERVPTLPQPAGSRRK